LHSLAENDPEVQVRIAAFPHHPDRLLGGQRSSRTRLRGQPGASGWEHHRLHVRRLPHDREMARDSQGVRSRHQADRAHVQSTHRALLPSFHARTRRSALCRAFANAGARRSRNRGSRHSACARAGWWPDGCTGPIYQHPPLVDYGIGAAASTPCDSSRCWAARARGRSRHGRSRRRCR